MEPCRENGPLRTDLAPSSCFPNPNESLRKTINWGIGYFISREKGFATLRPYLIMRLNYLIHLTLFQPDIPQNVGAVLRLGACFNLPVHVIEPCGFIWDDKRLKRAGMDYLERAELTRHTAWPAYRAQRQKTAGRLILFTTKGAEPFHQVSFAPGDHLMFGRESAGVPDEVHEAADVRVFIPMAAGARSLNLAQSAAIAAAEALRQLNCWPDLNNEKQVRPTNTPPPET